jgi:cytochrome c553
MKTIVGTLMSLACCAAILTAADAGHAEYDKSCKSCHGAMGTPNPAIAKMMKVEMRDLGSAEVQAQSDADLKKIITEGKGKMKPTQSAKNPDNIVAFVRTLRSSRVEAPPR